MLVALGSIATGGRFAPSIPNLSYTASNQFTITNYDSTLIYNLSNCTRSGNVITVSSSGATVTATYSGCYATSTARTMLTAANARILDSIASSPFSVGCAPRPAVCCPSGTIAGADGTTCVGGGTMGCFYECGSPCCSNCFGLFLTCWNWHWTDYTSSGYTLFGSVWGKAT